MMRDHDAVITVQGYAGVMKRLLRVLHSVVKFRHSALEYRAEVPRY